MEPWLTGLLRRCSVSSFYFFDLPMEVKVSVSFLSPAKIRHLNKDLRGKSYTPAVLSFPYYEGVEGGVLLGEVLICKSEARKLAKKGKISEEEQVNALVIHGIREILTSHKKSQSRLIT